MINDLSNMVGHDVPRETFQTIEAYVALLVAANADQNLVAASTISNIWERHILDSAQLVAHAPATNWIDIGSGAGLPGIVTAILTGQQTTLVEPRRLRFAFLTQIVAELGLDCVIPIQGKPAKVHGKFGVITARAVASATDLLRMTLHLSHSNTVWLLPKGRTAQKELDEVRAAWHGEFRLEPSRTDDESSILIATGVRPWGKQ